ncbi:MAG: hypothetical protein QHC67_05980 [Sphingobium sp.]|uniref:hypothetical protein n=1 Tax=Sphingobium sp. TaxID=1912891 RepID=UPI0029A75409|nr:hypothetical protein [Sphingobium sp.]MDX3909352.1 hypothetical protein [Sphingobium sp.]
MNDYLPRNEISPVDRVAPRPILPVTSVRAADNAGAEADRQPIRIENIEDGANIAAESEGQLASAAEYARIHAEVASILSSIRASGSGSQTIVDIDGAITAMTPMPFVIVPMPPASKAMVEQAARVAQRLMADAALAHAAQAHVKPGTVDQILSQVA